MAGGDEHGPYITVAFTLPPGSFATVLLRELMKNETDESVPSKDGIQSEDGTSGIESMET